MLSHAAPVFISSESIHPRTPTHQHNTHNRPRFLVPNAVPPLAAEVPAPAPAPPPAAPPAGSATSSTCECILLQGGTGELRFWPSLLGGTAQQRLFEELTLHPDLLLPQLKNDSCAVGSGRESKTVVTAGGGKWMQRPIKLFGKEILQPRLTCFYGVEGVAYR